MTLKNRKKERIRINNIDDFEAALKREEYIIDVLDKEKIAETFEIDNSVIEILYRSINDAENTYRADDIRDFIDYMKKIILFKDCHKKLCEKISEVKKLSIDRVEYEREQSIQENVEDIIKSINDMEINISRITRKEDQSKLESLEKEIEENYLYAKDIELLKKMLLASQEAVNKRYNEKTKTKTISIEVPKEIDYKYIKVNEGSVEYHQHLSKNIPRIQRLIKNIHKYMKRNDEGTPFRINQSEALQDSINMAVAIFNGKEFRAISGSDEIENSCKAPSIEEEAFKSCKVNKLGKLGIGYNRINDSEKKIFEEIHKQIEGKALKDEGNLILFSKWEPCPSCYFVISQFCKKHPNIKVKVKYLRKYGEV